MKINKTIKGEPFTYNVDFIPNTMTAHVRWWKMDSPVVGVITPDFKKIILPNSFTQATNTGVFPVKYLTLPISKQWDAKDYNSKMLPMEVIGE